jgi:non-ribosomal peptide synthase protein (TIGR01720 family)
VVREAARVWGAPANEILLAAVVRAFAGWTGEARLLIDVEGHGREAIGDDIDLSRTVGWFTSIYPVVLDLRGEAGGPAADVRAVARQLQEVPGHGLGYGLLRHFGTLEDAAALRALPPAEVSFLYLGQLGQGAEAAGAFRPADWPTGPDRAPGGERTHLLDVKGGIFGGRLEVFLTHSPGVHRRETVTALAGRIAAALRDLLADCRRTAGEPLVPGVERRIAEDLLLDPGVEAVYPASPLQHGILFHTLDSPQSGLYVQQLICSLAGELDAAVLEQAWLRVIARHPVLRTSFLWTGLPEPLQVVHREARLPFAAHDWSGLPAAEGELELERLLAADRRGFDLYQAPLLRLTLARLGAGESRLVWTYHHALLDGWSVPLVLGEVFAGYKAILQGREPVLAVRRPFADYIEWLRGQDHAAAERFWRQRLAGFRSTSRIGALPLPAEEEAIPTEPREKVFEIPSEVGVALRAFGRRHQITQNALVHGAWSLVLAHLSAEPDVVYGTVVSGRSAPLDGIESMIGAFVNTLPVRLRPSPEVSLLSWLGSIQGHLAELHQVEHTPLVEIQGWSEVPRHQPLFESLLAFESYPVEEAVAGSEGMQIHDVRNLVRVNYPLVAEAMPRRDAGEPGGVGGSPLLGFFQLRYDPRRFDEATVERMGNGMILLLSAFPTGTGHEDLGSFLARLVEADRRHREQRGRQIAEDDRSTLKGMRRRVVTGA